MVGEACGLGCVYSLRAVCSPPGIVVNRDRTSRTNGLSAGCSEALTALRANPDFELAPDGGPADVARGRCHGPIDLVVGPIAPQPAAASSDRPRPATGPGTVHT